jgi:hypothetical protein
MEDCWIFNVKDDQNARYRRKGIEIYRHRMLESFWGLREYNSDGRKAANIRSLKIDDKVVFYLIGEFGKQFLGTAKIASQFVTLEKNEIDKLSHEEFLDWNQGVYLNDIVSWNKTLPIERLRGKVTFVPSDTNYGSFFQGSIKGISRTDFGEIENEHQTMVNQLLEKGLIHSSSEG